MIEEKSTQLRQLLECSLKAFKKHFSKQTGFIHYSPTFQENESFTPIPVVENLLYSLTLFQTKTVENIAFAKELLDKILNFQDPKSGNFPIFLHDYPQCKDQFIGSQILPTLFYILKNFHTILGDELRKKTETSSLFLLDFCLTEVSRMPFHKAIKIASSSVVFGKGENLLSHLLLHTDKIAYNSPEHLGDVIVALQMVYPKIDESPWKPFWEHLEKTWHPYLHCYAGTGFKEYQEGFEPKVTLYDLFLSLFSNSLSKRVLNPVSAHFYTALIQLSNESFHPLQSDDKNLLLAPNYSFSLLSSEKIEHPYTHSLKFLFGDLQNIHSLMCQTSLYNFNASLNDLSLDFLLTELPNIEDKEKAREIGFFINLSKDLKIKVEDSSSTTFKLNERVKISTPQLSFSLKFSLVEGSGDFIGHIMRGNRPSQSLSHKSSFEAYDMQIFLRTLRRSTDCKINVKLLIEKD